MRNILVRTGFRLYKVAVLPLLESQGLLVGSAGCRFYPSCSEYTKQALEQYGCIRGAVKGFWRILRCNPFHSGGVDPLK